MPLFLLAHVLRNPPQLPSPHGTQIVARRPAQRLVAREPIAVRKARAGAFEALDEPRDVVRGGKLEQEVDVIAHDADLDDTCTVPLGLGEEKATKEFGDLGIDQRQARECRPREVGIDADGHR